ncbi:MAG: hypothetical protein OXI63_18795 [Candidatus Poribacteria bacterium]|nr:hypothetical protein [Candidatus Poribacteria bacterium]
MAAPYVLSVQDGATVVGSSRERYVFILFSETLDTNYSPRTSDIGILDLETLQTFFYDPRYFDTSKVPNINDYYNEHFGLPSADLPSRMVYILTQPSRVPGTDFSVRYTSPDRFYLRDLSGDRLATFTYSNGYVYVPPKPPVPSGSGSVFYPRRRFNPMNLRNFDRDLSIIDVGNVNGFSSVTESDLSATTFSVVSDGNVHSGSGTVGLNAASLALSANKLKARGVYLSRSGPKNQATMELFRIKADVLCASSKDMVCYAFLGVGPASVTDAAAGNDVTKITVVATGRGGLFLDDIVAIKPFAGTDAGKPVCFGLAFGSVEAVTSDVVRGWLSVQSMHFVPNYDSYNR